MSEQTPGPGREERTDEAAPSGTPNVFSVYGDLPAEATTTMLEASAGTGKTWTIAALVARMVVEGVAPLEEMLVVTFGRAASQELRERVRERLVEVERAFAALERGEEPTGDAMTAYLLAVDDQVREVRARRLREALGRFDAATIATTHQFCQMVLKGLGVAGDTDAGATLVEDLDELLVEVVDDLYLRGFARAGDPAFSRKEALEIARKAVGDPSARLEPRDATPGSPAARRLGFATAVRDEMEVRKRRLGVLSYDDLLSQLAQVLESQDSPARQRMRQRWSVVLVDEFQDTDPVQWQVLDRAFTGHARMVLIGDPKQAIYAFRGGDVVTYLQARRTAGTIATLGTSYRSDAPLLDRLQTLLTGAELGDPEIVVRDVDAHHQEGRLQGAPNPAPFRLRVLDRARFGGGRYGPKVDVLRQHVARDLAADVRELLNSGATISGRDLRASDVAVLCPKHRQAAFVAEALTEAGVPVVLASGGSVFTTEGARQWLALLEAIERPQISGRVRAAGLTAFFGMTAAQLGADDGEGVTNELAERLRAWGDLLRERGVAAVLEAAAGAGMLERVLGTTGGERLLTDLRHVAEVLHEHAHTHDLGVIALCTWLREQMREGATGAAAAERPRRLDSDDAAVQVLTIHGSKGLEFGIVYLPFLADNFIGDPTFPLFHDEAGVRCLDVGGAPFATSTLAAARSEDLGEDLRLAYVALTRAKSQVVAWWLPSGRNTPSSPLHRLIFGRTPGAADVPHEVPILDDAATREHAQKWEAIGALSVETADPVAAAEIGGGSSMLELTARHWSRLIDMVWRRTSYTSLSAAAEAEIGSRLIASEPEETPRDDEPDIAVASTAVVEADLPSPMAGLPAGATFGSLVHIALDHPDPAASGHDGDLRAEMLARVAEAQVRWPVAGLDVERLAEALVAVCDTPLGPLAGTTLREIGLTDRLAELDFELPLHGGDELPGGGDPTLADLAPRLRRHLPAGDPLLPYAEVVSDPAYAGQRLRGYLTGSVDVMLRVGERYLVVDYKTNWLGPLDEPLLASAYAPVRLAEAMTHSSYPLQALLYAVVLHRFLRWRQPGYDPERHLGGVLYLYVRGMCGPETPIVDGQPCGVFSWRPPAGLVTEISDLLDGVEAVA
ncbi:UvrD-helicase domain-containing protein [Pseudactinotalea sp.]|uniref:UvrD-helicase domain-containing protein n=1 Tax=Pseudactinotalea sp. TaxID=1926260 RepID=UPI003B3AE328